MQETNAGREKGTEQQIAEREAEATSSEKVSDLEDSGVLSDAGETPKRRPLTAPDGEPKDSSKGDVLDQPV